MQLRSYLQVGALTACSVLPVIFSFWVVAKETGDAFCKMLFRKCGQHIGRMVISIKRNLEKKNRLKREDSLSVLCVGSVFKSYELIRDGIFSALEVNGLGT